MPPLKIVSWNVQWCRGVDGRVDPRRIVEQARALGDFDVLCLQEVAANFPGLPGSRGENQFAIFANLLPDFTPIPGAPVDLIAAGARRGERRAFGNLVLSRLPVLQALRIQLPWPPDSQARRSMPRMLVEATIEAPFGAVRVMTTHLEYYSGLQRAAQVESIRARHAEACAHARAERERETPERERETPGRPRETPERGRDATRRDDSESPFRSAAHTVSTILTGDFNLRPDDPLHARIREPFADGTPELIDAWQQLYPGQAHQPTNGVHDREQWPEPYACDYVFASADLAPRLQALRIDAETQASDHQPVLVELE
ncbi:MAG: endonuclease/exonuclease/phosphatase family protein [Burkholderiaceae bacterium]|nr:endonuclease/exonuclease/phosphatase family protein [Burkholderiaceae bacterium]